MWNTYYISSQCRGISILLYYFWCPTLSLGLCASFHDQHVQDHTVEETLQHSGWGGSRNKWLCIGCLTLAKLLELSMSQFPLWHSSPKPRRVLFRKLWVSMKMPSKSSGLQWKKTGVFYKDYNEGGWATNMESYIITGQVHYFNFPFLNL